MSPARLCPDCGATLPDDAPRGLCPRCLMGAALSRSGDGLGSQAEVTVSLHPVGSPGTATGSLATLAETLGGIPRVLLRDTEGGSGIDPVIQPASPEMPEVPDRAARLQLFGEIARGGMGAVLKGRDVDIGRDLAVKVLLDRHRDNPDLARRFIEEAQIAGQLQHPGVVPIYELGAFADRRPYFAMKLVKGRTLAAILAERAGPAEGQMGLLSTMLQVGQTVAFAHARGVIHRDLKPSNVMVGGFGEVQVMDWGLAKVLPRGGATDDADAGRAAGETVIATARSGSDSDSDLSRAGSVLGTPAYMAPEQARGEVEAVDERADVFALGSILCEILTGRPAFIGRSSAEIQRKAARGDLADASSRLESCGADAELLALTTDCLAPEPEDRPRNASAFVERLGGYLTSIEQRLRAAELQRAAEHARAEEAVRGAHVERQRRRYQVGLAASLLVLSVVGGLWFSYWMRQRQARESRVALALQQAVFLRDQAATEPDDVGRWEAARRGLDAARRTLADLDAPEVLKSLEPMGQEVQAGLTAAHRGPRLIEALTEAQTGATRLGPYGVENLYTREFHEAGLDLEAKTPEELGAAIRALTEPVSRAAIAALDGWAMVRRQLAMPEPRWQRPLEVARVADPDPFRDRVRAALLEPDAETRAATLRALVDDPKAAGLSPQSAVLLARALCEQEDPPAAALAAMLRAVAERHPEDYPANLTLANVLLLQTPPARDEAVGYLRAARAIRPDSGQNLVRLLKILGRDDEAATIALALFDRRGQGWRGLANLCLSHHQFTVPPAGIDAMVAAGREAVRRHPEHPSPHAMLGTALLAGGRSDEAIGELRAAIQRHQTWEQANAQAAAKRGNIPYAPIDPVAQDLGSVTLGNLHELLGLALRDQGDFAGALAEFRAAHELTLNTDGSLTAHLVAQTEPKARLAGQFDAVLRGMGRRADVAKLRTFASMAYDVGHYAAASELFAAALESEEESAAQDSEGVRAAQLYDAACAAALAGCGRGRDAPPPDDPARAQRRQQALQWLRDTLAIRDRQRPPIASGGMNLGHWEHDPDLAGVRDAGALDALPEEERRAWRALWAEVEREVAIEAARSWFGLNES